MEGTVIKQLNHEIMMGESRAIIKNKNEKFKEKQKETKAPSKIPEHLAPLFESFTGYLNANRVSNVLSKEEQISQKCFGRLLGAFIQDAKLEYERDELNGESISKEDWGGISKFVNRHAAEVFRTPFLKQLES